MCFIFLNIYLTLFVWVFFLHVYVHHMCALCPEKSEKMLDTAELDLQMAVNHHVGALTGPIL